VPEIKTLSSIAREVTLQTGSVIRCKPVSAMVLMEEVKAVVDNKIQLPQTLYDAATLERWFPDENQRHEVNLAQRERFQAAVMGLVSQTITTSKAVMSDVTGLSVQELRELSPLDWANVGRVALEMLEKDAFVDSLAAFFSGLGDLGVLFARKANQFKDKMAGAGE